MSIIHLRQPEFRKPPPKDIAAGTENCIPVINGIGIGHLPGYIAECIKQHIIASKENQPIASSYRLNANLASSPFIHSTVRE